MSKTADADGRKRGRERGRERNERERMWTFWLSLHFATKIE